MSETLDIWSFCKQNQDKITKVFINLEKNQSSNSVSTGSGDYDYEWTASGNPKLGSIAHLEKPKEFCDWDDFPVWSPDGIKSGDSLFVLWCVYSSGDSFGHGTGYSEVLAVYKDVEVAKKALGIWNKQIRQSDATYTIKTPFTKDVFIDISNPGSGYFEDLTDVNLAVVTVL